MNVFRRLDLDADLGFAQGGIFPNGVNPCGRCILF